MSGTSTAAAAYEAVSAQWQKLNAEGLKSLGANDLDRAEAQFIAAANVCAAYTKSSAHAELYRTAGGGASGVAPNAPPPAVHRALSLFNLGITYVKLQKPDNAKHVFSESIEILRVYTLSDYNVVGNVCRELANIHNAEGALGEALQYYKLAFEYFDRSHNPASPAQASLALYSTAMIHHRQRNLQLAEDTYRKALDLAILSYGTKHRNVGQVTYSLGHLLVDLQKWVDAKQTYLHAATILEEAGDPTFTKAMADYSDVLLRLTEEDAERNAKLISQKHHKSLNPQTIVNNRLAANALRNDSSPLAKKKLEKLEIELAQAEALKADIAAAEADPLQQQISKIEKSKAQDRKAALKDMMKQLNTDKYKGMGWCGVGVGLCLWCSHATRSVHPLPSCYVTLTVGVVLCCVVCCAAEMEAEKKEKAATEKQQETKRLAALADYLEQRRIANSKQSAAATAAAAAKQ